MADFSDQVEKALPPRRGKSKRRVDPGGRGIHLRRGEEPDWKTWGEALLFQTKDGERAVTPRGSMSQDRWDALVERSKDDPDFAVRYEGGEPVETGPKYSLDQDNRPVREDAARVTPGEPLIGNSKARGKVELGEPIIGGRAKPAAPEALKKLDRTAPPVGREEILAAAKAMPAGPERDAEMQRLAKLGIVSEAQKMTPEEVADAEMPVAKIISGPSPSPISPEEEIAAANAPAARAPNYVDEAGAGGFPARENYGGSTSPLGILQEEVMRAMPPQGAAQTLPTMDLTDPAAQELPVMDLTGPQELPVMDLTEEPPAAAMAPGAPPLPIGGAGPNGKPSPEGQYPTQLAASQALPSMAAMSNGKALVDEVAGMSLADAMNGGPGATSPGAGAPPAPGGASASYAGGGGFRAPGLQYPEVDPNAEADALRAEAKKLQETTDAEMKGEADRQVALKADLLAKQADIDKLNAAQMEGFERNFQEMERYNSAYQQTMAEMQARSSQAIDTNRYFRNMDIAKRVTSVLAGALYGFLGKGLEWQQHLDSMVEQDIKAQESDRASAVRGLEAKAKGFFDAGEFAMKMGARRDEVYGIRKAALYKAMDMFLANAERETKNMEVRQRAAQMRFDIGAKIADAEQRGRDLVQRRVDQMNADAKWTAAEEAKDRRFRAEMAVKQQALAAKGAKGGKLSPRLAQRLIQLNTAKSDLDQMEALLSKGALQTLGDESVKHNPEFVQNAQEALGLTTAPSRRVALASLARSVIAGVEARPGALTLSDDAALTRFGLDVGLASTKTRAILNHWREKAKNSRAAFRQSVLESEHVDIGPDDEGADDAFEPTGGEEGE